MRQFNLTMGVALVSTLLLAVACGDPGGLLVVSETCGCDAPDAGGDADIDGSADAGVCCFDNGDIIVCPPGTPVPDASVITLPICHPK